MIRSLTLAVLIVTATAGAAPSAPALLEVKATLTGEVLADGLVREGTPVNDGDALLYVKTVVGRGVAARAPADGVVREVLVRPGQVITEKGAVVVRLAPR